MNTLSRAMTAQILATPDTYTALRRYWRGLINSDGKHELTAAHHLLYLALMGKDWRKAFTPITNQRKLDNGAFVSWALFRALATLCRPGDEACLLAPFGGLVSSAMLQQIRGLLPLATSYAYSPADFSSGAFPFEPYNVPAALLATSDDVDTNHA